MLFVKPGYETANRIQSMLQQPTFRHFHRRWHRKRGGHGAGWSAETQHGSSEVESRPCAYIYSTLPISRWRIVFFISDDKTNAPFQISFKVQNQSNFAQQDRGGGIIISL